MLWSGEHAKEPHSRKQVSQDHRLKDGWTNAHVLSGLVERSVQGCQSAKIAQSHGDKEFVRVQVLRQLLEQQVFQHCTGTRRVYRKELQMYCGLNQDKICD